MSSRRAHGEGTYYYREELNVWRWRGYYLDSCTGQRRRKELSATTKKELKEKVKIWTDALAIGKMKRIKMSEWSGIWLKEIIKRTVKPATYANYRISVNNHFNPAFGSIWLDELTTHLIQEYINRISNNHTARTVQTIRTHLITCLNSAIDYGYIVRNPAKATRAPRIGRSEKAVLTREDVVKILATAKNGEYEGANKNSEAGQYLIKCYYIMILLAAMTGMRQGECLGLQKRKIDLVTRKIRVDTNCSAVRGNSIKLDTPKTAYSIRTIDIPSFLADELKKWIEYQDEFENKYRGVFVNQNGLLLTNSVGGLVSGVNFMHRVWHPILEQAGIKKGIVFHDLRHFHASILFEKNVNVKVISERLGHSNTSVTLDVYSHLLGKTLQAEAIEALNGVDFGLGGDRRG